MTRTRNLLLIVAVVFACLLCVDLSVIGWLKYHSALVRNAEEYDKTFPNQITKLRIVVAYLILNITYLLWLFKRQKSFPPNFPNLLKGAAFFLVLAFITYPFSTDIFLYLHYGLMGLNGINPYLTPSNSYLSELSFFFGWPQTSTYGPVSQLLFMVSALAVKVSPALAVYAFKLICLLVHILNTYLIWRFLQNHFYRNLVTTAYLINPLLLTEYIVSAHLDVLIANAAILLVICLYRNYFAAAILMTLVGVFEKTLPIIWIPLLIGFLVYKRQWRSIAIAASISLAFIIILSQSVLPSIDAWMSLINPGVKGKYALSFHYILNATLSYLPTITLESRQRMVSLFTSITYLGFVLYYVFTLLKPYLRPSYSKEDLVVDIGWVTLVLLLFSTPWLMPWYPSILLPIAALSLNYPLFVLASLTFCTSSNILFGVAGSGISVFSILATIVVLAPPVGMLLFGKKLLNRPVVSKLLLNNCS